MLFRSCGFNCPASFHCQKGSPAILVLPRKRALIFWVLSQEPGRPGPRGLARLGAGAAPWHPISRRLFFPRVLPASIPPAYALGPTVLQIQAASPGAQRPGVGRAVVQVELSACHPPRSPHSPPPNTPLFPRVSASTPLRSVSSSGPTACRLVGTRARAPVLRLLLPRAPQLPPALT